VLVAPAPASAAAPKRGDSKNEAIVFVHGINLSQNTDCTADWAAAGSVLRKQDFTGSFVTFGYYKDNKNCTKKVDGTTLTSLNTIAKELAKYIYNQFSKHNKPVDIVAHSMGGLIARKAISGTQRGEDGFPEFLYVEDVVTIATPHTGSNAAGLCAIATQDLQCRQMATGSGWLKDLAEVAQNPQSKFGTDWSTIGSASDQYVSVASARGMSAGHAYTYRSSAKLDHTQIREHKSTAKTFDVDWSHAEGSRSGYNDSAEASLYITGNALHRWRTW
jgi:triacylglycerol esterase/lipase EstA (alpha/beta hydrolase family)